jgi:hypothetical protein
MNHTIVSLTRRGKYVFVESVTVEIPRIEYLCLFTKRFSPFSTVRKRLISCEYGDYNNDEKESDLRCSSGGNLESLTSGEEIPSLTEGKDTKVESWEVMMEEELTFHKEERKVMQCPSENSHTNSPVISSPGC